MNDHIDDIRDSALPQIGLKGPLCRHKWDNGGPTSMSIEDFFSLTDRVMRKAAEQNPDKVWLQNLPTDDKDAKTNTQKEIGQSQSYANSSLSRK